MVIITVMLFTLNPATHAEEAASLQAGKQTGANGDGHVVLNSEQITQPDGQVPVDQEGEVQIDPVEEATQNTDQATPPAEQAFETEQQSVISAVYDEPYNLALGLSYEWSEAPEAAYSDDNNKLTDGNYGELNISDPAWVGHRNNFV